MLTNPAKPPIEERDGVVYIRLRVQPKASRNSIRVETDGRIRVGLTAPPAGGAANTALRNFMGKTLGVPKSAVTLSSGSRSRDKTVVVRGVSHDEVRKRLLQFAMT